MKLRPLFGLVLAFLVAAPAVRAQPACVRQAVAEVVGAASEVRYVRGDPSLPISFGLEAEVNVAENPALMDVYRLPSYSDENWKKLPSEERVALGREWEEKNRHAHDAIAFVRLADGPAELPETALFEGDGNFELNGFVFKTYEETADFVHRFVERFGKASLQGHVVYPRTAMPGTAGYVIFEADQSQLQSFERNYARYLANPSVTPAKNLVHHSLGPLSEADADILRESAKRVAKGRDPIRLLTTRVTSAPVFRGDSYPSGYVGHELRQFHKRSDELLQEMDHLSNFLAQPSGLSRFGEFEKVPLISSKLPARRARELGVKIDRSAWDDFFNQVATEIRKPFPNLMYGGAQRNERFFFPLRDWANHPLVRALPEAERTATQDRIVQATRKYIEGINQLIASSGQHVDRSTLRELQILSARWGHEVNLSPEFEKFENAALTPPAASPVLIETDPIAALRRVMPVQDAVFPGTSTHYYSIKMDPSKQGSEAYRHFLERTVEVVYSPVQPFGHIELRVGKRFYGFNFLRSTRAADFSPHLGENGKVGFAFEVPAQKIQEVQQRMEAFYASSGRYNVPGFDAYSPQLELIQDKKGRLSYHSDSPDYANNLAVEGEIVSRAGRKFLRSPNGWEEPIIEKGTRLYVQSYSCATSCTKELRDELGIQVRFQHGAKSLLEALRRGNPGGTAPNAIIDYAR